MLNYSVPWRARWPVPVNEVWFAQAGDTLALPPPWMPRLLRLSSVERRVGGLFGRWTPRNTLITRLDGLDELNARLSRTVRYQIRRAFDRDELAIVADWSASQLVEFANAFDLANPNRPMTARLEALARLGRLTVTAAQAAGETLCAHAYVDDGRRARLLHSYSRRPREADNAPDDARKAIQELGALVGRANKALHWRDLETFRDRGFEVYDWGGFSGREDSGVDRFKQLFLGEQHAEWDFDGAWPPRFGALRF